MHNNKADKKYRLSVILSEGGSSKELKSVCRSFMKQENIKPDDIQIIYCFKDESIEEKFFSEFEAAGMNIVLLPEGQSVLPEICGEMTCFSNGYDEWEHGSLDRICSFLEENSDKTDVAIGKQVSFFDNEKNKNPGRESSGGILVDAADDESRPIFDIRSAVFRTESLTCAVPYSGLETMAVMEMLVNAVNAKETYGMIQSAYVFVKDDEFNVDYSGMETFMKNVDAYSISRHGRVTAYADNVKGRLVLNAISGRKNEQEVRKSLAHVQDSVIFNGYKVNPVYIKYAYSMKYGHDIYRDGELNEKGQLIYDGSCVFDIGKNGKIVVKIIEIDDSGKNMTFEGYTNINLIDDKASVIVRGSNGIEAECEVISFPVKDENGYNGEIIYNGVRFEITVPVEQGCSYEFFVKTSKRDKMFSTAVKMGAFSRLNEKTRNSYFVKNGLLVKFKGGRVVIEKNTAARHFRQEVKYLREISSLDKKKVARFRMLYWITRPFNSGKPIWIVVDRPHVANDNGEHFFRYLMKTGKDKKVKPFFLLKKSSPDFERISKYGPMLEYGSVRHKLKTLHSSKIISAAGNNLAVNPFGKNKKFYQDLYNFDFVYLRHGVSHNDQSSWLNRLDKNIRVLDSTSKYEYDSLIGGNYLYDESKVFLTGLPRYDNLTDDCKNIISIMPTWRKNLEGPLMPHSSQRAYIRDFRETDYFRFYNSLINDKKLIEVMKNHGYTGRLYMHPVFEKQTGDFDENDVFEVAKGVADYQTVFRESNVLVTDYSSVAFDFAYLKKPVVYSQFDFESFYENHVWGKGYFTYEKNGFGPITKSVGETVDVIIDYIENDCRMKPEDIAKVEDFFPFTDRKNCERVYEAICSVK